MSSQDAGQPIHWHYSEMDDKNFQLHSRGSVLVVVVVFALLVFFTLLCLYAKWACRCRRLAAVAAASDHRPASAQRELTLPVVGLDRDTVNSFPVHVVSPSADEVQCSICLCNLVEGEKVKVLPGCNHGFHPECVGEWLKSQSSCPLCRASLIAESAQPAVSV